jgi:predicted DNA-binding antitoxin AbrB/MazE fold protein
MQRIATAVYERGTLRLLTPLPLPERAQVRIQILDTETGEDERQRVEAALLASGLVKPQKPIENFRRVSKARRAELAKLYAVGGPVSDAIIAERDER